MHIRLAIVSCSILFACAHKVPQNKATGADGKQKGAKPLTLENGVADDSGIVTYPGGDRVDWKLLELPEKKKGTLDVKLSWTTPRPGLRLAFDVFDQWGARVAKSKQGAGRNRLASVKGAKGKYFIRVYAVGRGDAGTYKLDVEFVEPPPEIGPEWWLTQEILAPPRLPDVPATTVTVACDLEKFDYANPDCADKCPTVNPRPGWKGCANTCTVNPPDAGIPACAKTMECDRRNLDRRILKCKKEWFTNPCPNPAKPDPNNPWCDDATIPPVVARVMGKSIVGSQVEIMIGVGSDSSIDKTWTAVVMRTGTNNPMPNGNVEIVKIEKNVTTGRVKLSAQQVEENKTIRFTAPPRPRP